jgi:hypothetical protein
MKVHPSWAIVATAASVLIGLSPIARAQGTAVGNWSDAGTMGIAQTKIIESGCTAAGTEFTCSLSALAEQRVSNPPRQGTCVDTTFTLGGQSFAGPCRASFGATIIMQRTGTPAVCNGATVKDGTTPSFQYANTLGVNLTLNNLTITVTNNVVTVTGERVDVDGTTVQTL